MLCLGKMRPGSGASSETPETSHLSREGTAMETKSLRHAPEAFTLNPSVRGGFTLLELIVVITIIGMLATLVVVNTRGVGPKARLTKATHDLQAILSAAEMIQTETGSYPESLEEMINPKDENGMALMGGLSEFPKDPWGNEYSYELVGGYPQVKCYGKDAVDGGEGEAADIIKPQDDSGGYGSY
jgi:general secretion pathway protein G